MVTVIQPYKEIPLSETSVIRFDFDGSQYRGAYTYRPRDAEKGDPPRRAICKAGTLADMLCGLFNVIVPNETVRGVERYIRATEWGKDLP